MESSSIPTSATVAPATATMVETMAARRGLTMTPERLRAAAVLDAWLAPRQQLMRAVPLSFLEPIEPGTALQWIARGGRSVTAPGR